MSNTATAEFKFYCSHCDQPLKCEVRFAGRQIQCPGCSHLIRIPNPPAGSGFTHISPESGRPCDTHIPNRRPESRRKKRGGDVLVALSLIPPHGDEEIASALPC